MDFRTACSTLEVRSPFTKKDLKHAYYKHALRYHPDKSKETDAANKFKAAVAAYEYLQTYLKVEEELDTASGDAVYDSFISRLFGSIFDDPSTSATFIALYGQIKGGLHGIALRTFEKLEHKTATEVIEYMSAYRDVLGIQDRTIETFKEAMTKKMRDIDQIVLNPTVDNLLSKDVYCFNSQSGQVFYIPLWHEEIAFDESNNFLVVSNKLQLPDNVAIDHNNDLHVHVRSSLQEGFRAGTIPVALGEKVFDLPVRDLHVREQQTARIRGEGAPRINPHDILDVSQIGDIVVHLELY